MVCSWAFIVPQAVSLLCSKMHGFLHLQVILSSATSLYISVSLSSSLFLLSLSPQLAAVFRNLFLESALGFSSVTMATTGFWEEESHRCVLFSVNTVSLSPQNCCTAAVGWRITLWSNTHPLTHCKKCPP